MEFDSTVRMRRSVRGFHRDRPVPSSLLQEALELAQQSPSNCNAQPWRVFIASGAARDRLQAELLKAVAERADHEAAVDKFAGVYRIRQVECAAALYGCMGIAREDREGRHRAFVRNYEFFDAPAVAILAMHRDFGPSVALDLGAYMQTFMLALASRGIASCPQVSLQRFSDVTSRVLAIPTDLKIMCGISFGYEDASVPANRTRQARQALADNVTLLND